MEHSLLFAWCTLFVWCTASVAAVIVSHLVLFKFPAPQLLGFLFPHLMVEVLLAVSSLLVAIVGAAALWVVVVCLCVGGEIFEFKRLSKNQHCLTGLTTVRIVDEVTSH